MDSVLQDLRYAFRTLARSRGFTAVAVLTLALGIGATTAIFSVIDAVVLRPLPFNQPDRLVRVWETTPEGGDFSASEPNYLDFRQGTRTFDEMAAYRYAGVSLTGAGEPERLQGIAATHTLFPVLGVRPALGRSFLPDEDRPGGETRVAVLSHQLWQRRFGSDPGIVGRAITLDGERFTVTGVMPASFAFLDADLWIPLAPDPASDRTDHWLDMVGRLKPGVTIEQASAELDGIARRMGDQHPHLAGWGVRLATFSDWIVGPQFRRTAFVLLGAVGFLLLMACTNLANLLLARATVRQTEIGVRAALGAGRTRLVRQLLTESVLLALLGASIGLGVAFWAVEALRAVGPSGVPRLDEIGLNGRVVAFALGTGLLTSLIFGLAPAVQASRIDVHELLKQAGRNSGAAPGRRRAREALAVFQVALAMVMLIGAGLMVRSFLRLQAVDSGFEAENAFAVPLQLPEGKYREDWQKVGFFEEVTTRLENVPGVVSVAATTVDPFGGWNLSNNVTPEELAAEAGPSGYMQAGWRAVTPGFFRTMGVPLLRGRLFTDRDPSDGPRLTVVTETLARRLWPDEDPVGKRLFWGGIDGEPYTVVGVVGDYRDVQLESDPPPVMFLPYARVPMPEMTLIVKTNGAAATPAASIRREIWAVDKDLPVSEVRPLEQNREAVVATPRFNTLLLGFFAAVALALAAVGIYGMMAFTVAQRTREFGVRMALGAEPGTVSRMVVREGLLLAVLGVGLGSVGAWGLTRILASLLYGTTPTDPVAFAGAGLLLGGILVFASYLPARRATRVDPMVVLRGD